MRRPLIAALVLAFGCASIPMHVAFAQGKDADPDQEAKEKKKKEEEWGDKQAPLPQLRNAGPCPYVKVLYDAGRYVELKDNKETAAAVGYTGEIEGLSSGCSYKANDPIKVQIELLFGLGKGPTATSDRHTYRYWVAVTDRNNEVIAKEYFNLPVSFPAGQDRTLVTDKIQGIVIPRIKPTVSGSNFEVLVGFDVTPEMVAFNRLGKRFRPNAGVAQAGQSGQTAAR
ncbi:MAG: Tat pathway signal sequence domain protein [Caulobacteraceae bacterium]